MRISDWSSDVCSSDLRNTKLQAAYLKHLENVLTLAGEQDAAVRAKAIYDFEKQVATVHWDKNDSSDATKVYNKMTIAELAAAAPGFEWQSLIRGIGVNEDRSEERRVGKEGVSTCRSRR